MALRTLESLGSLAGKRVIVRADFNVPLKDGRITDDGRVRAALPTLNALINACQHRGTTLTRVGKGNQSTFTCPFHAWCYKSDGRLVKVKAPGEYPEGFDKATRGLKKARIVTKSWLWASSLSWQA